VQTASTPQALGELVYFVELLIGGDAPEGGERALAEIDEVQHGR
jgi:hypothetical protein